MSFVSCRIFTSAPVALQMPMMTSPPRPMSRATNCCGTMTSRRGACGGPTAAPPGGGWTRSESHAGTLAPCVSPAAVRSAPSPDGLAGSGERAPERRSPLRARLPLRLRLAAAGGLRWSLAFFFFFLTGLAEQLSSRSFRRGLERPRLAEWLASRRSLSRSRPRSRSRSRSLSFFSFFSFLSFLSLSPDFSFFSSALLICALTSKAPFSFKCMYLFNNLVCSSRGNSPYSTLNLMAILLSGFSCRRDS
mmetsp:Transcript_25220/g.80130  ORF Transcript_25220/g.80130 Transcript_25220/m.80130 type:complete len:248 (+) Transcript_25220:428-1171(+)